MVYILSMTQVDIKRVCMLSEDQAIIRLKIRRGLEDVIFIGSKHHYRFFMLILCCMDQWRCHTKSF